jgi:hypothetical protein
MLLPAVVGQVFFVGHSVGETFEGLAILQMGGWGEEVARNLTLHKAPVSRSKHWADYSGRSDLSPQDLRGTAVTRAPGRPDCQF